MPEQPATDGMVTRSVVREAVEAWHLVKLGAIIVGFLLLAVLEALDGKFFFAIIIGLLVVLVITLRWAIRAIRASRASQSSWLTDEDRGE